MGDVSKPLSGDDDVRNSGAVEIVNESSGIGSLLWTILIALAGAGVIVGVIAGYVRIRRKWSE